MTSTSTPRSKQRLALAGVAGILAMSVGVLVVSPALAEVGTDATMIASSQSTVAYATADAVAAAEAEAAHAVELQAQIDAVVSLAYAQVGDSYSMGASGPDTFDCSGFTMWVYEEALGVSLPHNTHAQWDAIEDTWYVGEKEPQPGDLVFFFENGADHVGLYVGDGMMVHAENPGSGVIVSPIYEGYWADDLTGFGRVVH